MLFDVFDNVFLLNLALEATEGTLDGLAFLNLDFSHALQHPLTGLVAPCVRLPRSGEYVRLSHAGADSRRKPRPEATK